MAHPWLLSSTTSLAHRRSADRPQAIPNPPLPPSPSTLARPIANPSSIDPELLSSLRIIWGRHTDPHGESIKRDLCSPVGSGVHAKAFYFLLVRYREESRKISQDKVNQFSDHDIGSMNFNLGWDLGAPKRYEGNMMLRTRSAAEPSPPYSRAPSPTVMCVPQVSGLAPPLMSRTATGSSTRDRPASPAGPRAHAPSGKPTKIDTKHSQLHGQRSHIENSSSSRPTSSLGSDRGVIHFGSAAGPRPPPPKRGYTYSHPANGRYSQNLNPHFPRFTQQPQRPKSSAEVLTLSGGPGGPGGDGWRKSCTPSFTPSTLTHTTTAASTASTIRLTSSAVTSPPLDDSRSATAPKIHAPVPFSASTLAAPVVAMELDLDLNLELAALTAQGTLDVELQSGVDGIAERVTEMVSDPPPPSQRASREASRPLSHSDCNGGLVKVKVEEDKENRGIAEEGWSYFGDEDGRTGLGLGVGLRKEMGNVIYLGDNGAIAGAKGRKDKERKGKREYSNRTVKKNPDLRLFRNCARHANDEREAFYPFCSQFAHFSPYFFERPHHGQHQPNSCRWRIQGLVLEPFQLEITWTSRTRRYRYLVFH